MATLGERIDAILASHEAYIKEAEEVEKVYEELDTLTETKRETRRKEAVKKKNQNYKLMIALAIILVAGLGGFVYYVISNKSRCPRFQLHLAKEAVVCIPDPSLFDKCKEGFISQQKSIEYFLDKAYWGCDQAYGGIQCLAHTSCQGIFQYGPTCGKVCCDFACIVGNAALSCLKNIGEKLTSENALNLYGSIGSTLLVGAKYFGSKILYTFGTDVPIGITEQ